MIDWKGTGYLLLMALKSNLPKLISFFSRKGKLVGKRDRDLGAKFGNIYAFES